MASSFKKKTNRGRTTYPAGTKISLHNNQLLISSGVPSLDTVLGGGLAVGTALLLEEDNFGSYAKTLVKCFLAEGVTSGHSLFLAIADADPNEIWKNLPCPVDELSETKGSEVGSPSTDKDNSMKIAWRYQNLPTGQSNQSTSKFGHFFDHTKIMNPERMSKVTKYDFNARNNWLRSGHVSSNVKRSLLNPIHQNLLNTIKEVIQDKGHDTSNQMPQDQTILRIVIKSLGSPLWGAGDNATSDHSLTLFLYYLRGEREVMKNWLIQALVSVNVIKNRDRLYKKNTCLLGRAERLSDAVIRLESFAGSDKETNPIYKDYHVRIPRLNALTSHMPETLDLAFKLRRKKFVIEKLHLPPDISETVNRAQKNSLTTNTGTYSCGASLGDSKLDF